MLICDMGSGFFFEIGRIISQSDMGAGERDLTIDDDRLVVYEKNVRRGFLTFEVSSIEKELSGGFAHQPKFPVPWIANLVVSADDAISLRIRLKIDMQKTKTPVSYDMNA